MQERVSKYSIRYASFVQLFAATAGRDQLDAKLGGCGFLIGWLETVAWKVA